MPNIKSAIKRMRSDARKEECNGRYLSELKTLNKKLFAIKSANEDLDKLAGTLTSRYDGAVTKGVIPRGRADRKKSRIALYVAKIKQHKAKKKSKKKS